MFFFHIQRYFKETSIVHARNDSVKIEQRIQYLQSQIIKILYSKAGFLRKHTSEERIPPPFSPLTLFMGWRAAGNFVECRIMSSLAIVVHLSIKWEGGGGIGLSIATLTWRHILETPGKLNLRGKKRKLSFKWFYLSPFLFSCIPSFYKLMRQTLTYEHTETNTFHDAMIVANKVVTR